MILALVGAGLALLVLPGVTASWASKRLSPREATRAVAAALLLGTTALVVAFTLAAVPAIASLVDVPGIVDHCRGALAPLATDPTILSWIAGAVAVAMIVAFARGAGHAIRGARRARIEPWLGDHETMHDIDLVVVPTAQLVAFGVPGTPPQVIVSQGLVDRLDDAETAAVIEHEVAHHRLRHWQYLVVLAAVERACGWLPFVRRGVDSARTAMEAWADEETGTGDHRHRESLRRALLGMSSATGRTLARLRRLESPPSSQPQFLRIATYVPVVLGILTSGLLVAGWFSEAHHAVALGGHCAGH